MLALTDEMIKLQEKKVFFIAKKYSNNYNIEDLYQAGMMGVVKASKNYDENIGVKFSTFSEKYILGEILEYIRKDKNIKVSKDFISLKRRINVEIDKYYELNNYYPTIEELSNILSEDKNKILEVLNTNQNVKSIDEVINDNDDILLKDTISIKDSIDISSLIDLKDALKQLKKEEINLIKERYYNGKSQTELAKEMNTSQVKVYRMERKILDELNLKMT